jgi:predicted nuclease of predicted toxin-antitoxin system
MEQIRFYLDEHIPSAVAGGLRRRGVDVSTVQEAGRSGLADPEQLRFARSEQRVLVTMDSGFLILASQGMSHAGIACASPRISIGEMIRANRSAWRCIKLL